MGRPREKLDLLGEGEQVIERLKKEPSGLFRERLLAVSLGLEGELGLQEIADRLGRSRATIQTWFGMYRSGGISKLCQRAKNKGGRKSALSPREWDEFRKKLAKGSFRTAQQAQDWLWKRFQVQRTLSTIRRWMGKLGARLKVVRPRHPQSNERKRQEFRSQLARMILVELKKHTPDFRGRPIRLWVADEARFGLQPAHRRAWVTKGVRSHKDSRCRYDWQYVWGALQIGGGGNEFLFTNKADQDVSCYFLNQISRRDPLAVHVVIWDGAGFHPLNGDSRMPSNVVVLRQPPYSPELNPVEKCCAILCATAVGNHWTISSSPRPAGSASFGRIHAELTR